MSMKEFKFIKSIGKGAFGKVDLVQRKEDGQIYAMKIVKISQLNTKEQENALNEVRVLASISHPNIIGYKEAFFDNDTQTLNIIMEYAEDGDLESKIKQHIKSKTHLSENQLWTYLIQMIEGLKALHDIKTMHRDLKSANVFLMKNGQVKLGDLNVSKVVKMGMVQTQTGTPYYASPEVWADKPYDYKSDIWSIGCVIYELCALRPPFRGNNIQQLYACVSKGVYEPIPNIYSNDLHKMLALLLQTNPANRPSCDNLLSNPILLKRMDYTKTFAYGGNNQLLNTIKLPKNFNEINQKLPKTKNYLDPTGLTFLKKTEIKTIQQVEPSENRIAGHDSKNFLRHKTIDQEIQIKREDSIKRPSSSKPDTRKMTPIMLNRKEYSSISKPVNAGIPTKVINSIISNRRIGDVPYNQNNQNNICNVNNINNENNNYNGMKIVPNSNSNILRNNIGNTPVSDINRGIGIQNKNNLLQLQSGVNASKPLRSSSARPTNSKIGMNLSKENSVSNLYKDIYKERESINAKNANNVNAPNNNLKNIIEKNILERPSSTKMLNRINAPNPSPNFHSNNNGNILNPNPGNLNKNIINLANPSNLVTNNYNHINININNNFYPNKNEYKPAYKPGNPSPLLRPSSCRDRIQNIQQVNAYSANSNQNVKKLINNRDNDHKVLINPIKLVENPIKRILPSNAGNNNFNNNNPSRPYTNNLLKGARPVQSSPYEPQYGGIVKIIQNNEARPIHYRK